MTIALRVAIPADASAIRALTRAAYAKWVPIIGREPLPMAADYDAAVLKHRFDLMYADDALVGLIETADEGETLLIVNVAIAPDFHGRGLGTQLMAHAETIARDRRCTRIRLYTHQRFTENITLYLRLGYVIDNEQPLADGGALVNMSKPLA
jgi:GNAT superfamily N-acetyltransferase